MIYAVRQKSQYQFLEDTVYIMLLSATLVTNRLRGTIQEAVSTFITTVPVDNIFVPYTIRRGEGTDFLTFTAADALVDFLYRHGFHPLIAVLWSFRW